MKLITIAVLSLIALPVLATKYAAPEARTVPSENDAVYLALSPDSGTHKVVSKDGDKTLWEFKSAVWHEEYFVSDDGSRVVIISWKHCKIKNSKEPAIRIIKQGEVEKEYSYNDVSTPRKRGDREIGPIGDFWRIWKEKPSAVKDQKLTVEPTGHEPIVIDLKTGALK